MIAGLLFNRLNKQERTAVSFEQSRCLRSRWNRNTCKICVSLCKQKALALHDRSIVFHKEKCTGCLACLMECPNDAFNSSFDYTSLLATVRRPLRDGPAVVFCCGNSADADRANTATIPCLGLLSEPILAALHCASSQDFYLDVRRCAGCENGHVLSLLHARIEKIIQKIGQASLLKIRYLTKNEEQPPTMAKQRRYFLNVVKSSVVELGREMLACDTDPCTQNTCCVLMHQKDAAKLYWLLQQTLSLLADDAVPEKQLLFSYFFTLTANNACNLCPSCTGMCPTGALKRSKEEGGKKLTFSSSKCSGCGLCVEFCRKKALTLRPGADITFQAAVPIA